MNEITPNILPAKNLAPLDPLFELKDGNPTTPVYIVDGLKELLRDCLKRNENTYKEIANTTEITSNFIQGKQIWAPNYWNNTWKVQPVNRADPNKVTAINIMQFYCTTQVKMITSSNPDIEPVDEYRTKDYKDKVRKAKAVWNRYEKKFYTPWFNQQEAIHAIVSGNYIESVQYDHMKRGITVFKEIFEKKVIETNPGFGQCFTKGCEYKGTYTEFVGNGQFIPNCPKCGGHEILPPTPPESSEFNSVVGIQPIVTGDFGLKLIPIQVFRYDILGRPEESSWSIERMSMSRRKLKFLLGNEINIPSQTVQVDSGVRSVKAMAEAGNTIGGRDNKWNTHANTDDQIIVDRFCVKPEDVAHIVNQQDTVTVTGEVIPKGQRLSDFCPPEGMTILAVNEGEFIIGLYRGVHHSQEISAGIYHMRFGTGLGRGSEDTVEVQKRFNRFDSQNTKYMDATATPASTYVTGSVDRKHVKQVGHPGVVIPINQEVAQALGTTDLVKHLTPGQMPAQFFSYTYDILNQYRQLTSHSTDMTGAFPGVNNETARGASITKANADSIWSPFQSIKGQVRIGTAVNTLRGYKKHFQGVAQDFSIGETKNKQTFSQKIKGEDLDCDIEFTIVRDSEQPKTMYDRQTDFANMMMLAGNVGGIEQLKNTDPKLLQALYKAFDIDLSDNTYDTLVDICEDRLDQAISLQAQFLKVQKISAAQGINIPTPPIETLLEGINPPIALEEPNHEQKAKWFMDYLDTPQGAKMGDGRLVVAVFIKAHFMMASEQARIMAGVAGASEAAAQEAILQKQAELAKEQEAAAEAQRQEEIQLKILEAENNNNQKELDRKNKLDVINLQATKAKELAVIESNLAIKEEKAKPKEKAAKR